jgi:KDO2-lipid IV(A) lauroyltransferase
MKWLRKFCWDPLEFLPVFLIYLLFKLLPVSASSWFAGVVARLIGPLLPVNTVGKLNLCQAFPENSLKEQKRILKKAWENLGRVVGEFPHLKKIADSCVEVVDHCDLQAMQEKKVPLIFFSAHMANWEVPHLVLTQRHIKISLLSRPPNNWLTRKFFEWVRYDPLVSIILKGGEGSKRLIRVFQNKENLGILLDQRLSEGEKLPFFGREAYTPVVPSRLAEKFGALMIPVQVERLEGAHFRITYHPPLKAKKDFLKTSLKINQIFEKWITERPEQWLWFHNRWKL